MKEELLEPIRRFDITLFTLGDATVQVSTIAKALLALLLLIWITRWLRARTVALLSRSPLDIGTRMTVATMMQYVLLVFGISMIMQNVGLKLSALSVLAGAIGVGLGFGLQNIVSNFVSGLIVMFERPVKIGDRVDIAGIEGDVIAINARSTRLRTARGAVAIVPNQKFITETVRNFAGEHEGVSAVQVAIKVPAVQDPEAAIEVMKDVIGTLGDQLGAREPEVNITAVDASGTTIEGVAWVRGDVSARARLQSQWLAELRRRVQGGALKLA